MLATEALANIPTSSTSLEEVLEVLSWTGLMTSTINFHNGVMITLKNATISELGLSSLASCLMVWSISTEKEASDYPLDPPGNFT